MQMRGKEMRLLIHKALHYDRSGFYGRGFPEEEEEEEKTSQLLNFCLNVTAHY